MTSTLSRYFHLHSQKRPDDLERIGHALNFKTSTAKAYAQAHYVSFVFKAVLYVAFLPVAETLSLVGRVCLSLSASFQKTVEKQQKAEVLDKQVQSVLAAWNRPIAPALDEHIETPISLAELVNDEKTSFEAIWVAARERLASADTLQPLIESFSSERLKAFLSNRLITNSGTICVSLRNIPNFETLNADKQALLISHTLNGKYFNAQEGLERLVASPQLLNQVLANEHLNKRALLDLDYSGFLSPLIENKALKAAFDELRETPASFNQLEAQALAKQEAANQVANIVAHSAIQNALIQLAGQLAEATTQKEQLKANWREVSAGSEEAKLEAFKALINNPMISAQAIANIASDLNLCLGDALEVATPEKRLAILNLADVTAAQFDTLQGIDFLNRSDQVQLAVLGVEKFSLLALSNIWHSWAEATSKAKKGSKAADPEEAQPKLNDAAPAYLDQFKRFINHNDVSAQAIVHIGKTMKWGVSGALSVAAPDKQAAILKDSDLKFVDLFFTDMGFIEACQANEIRAAIADCPRFTTEAINTIQETQGLYVDSLLRHVSPKTFAHIVFQGGGTDHRFIHLIRDISYNKHFITALEIDTCPQNILAQFSLRAQQRIIIDWPPKIAAIYALSQAKQIEDQTSILPHFEEVLSLWSEPSKRERILEAMELLTQEGGPRASVKGMYERSLYALKDTEATAEIPKRIIELRAALNNPSELQANLSESLADLPYWALKKLAYDCTQDPHLQMRLILALNNEQLIDVLDLVWTDASLLPLSDTNAQAVCHKIENLITYIKGLGDSKAQMWAHPPAAPDIASRNPCAHVLEILAYHQTEKGQFPYLIPVLEALSTEPTPDNTQLLYRLIDGCLNQSGNRYRPSMDLRYSVMETPRTLLGNLCAVLPSSPTEPPPPPVFSPTSLPSSTQNKENPVAPKAPPRNQVPRKETPTLYRAFVISTITAMSAKTLEGYLAYLDAQGNKQNWLNLISVMLSAQKYEGLEGKIALILGAAEKHLDLAELGSCFCDTEFMRLANSGKEEDQAALVKIFIGYLYNAVNPDLLRVHIESLREANESFCKAVFTFILENQENSQVEELALALIKDLKAMEHLTKKLENVECDEAFIKMCQDQLSQPGATELLLPLISILPAKALDGVAGAIQAAASKATASSLPQSPAFTSGLFNPVYLDSAQKTRFRNKLILMKIMNGVKDSQRLVEILQAITNRNMMAAALRALNRSENPKKSEILKSVMPHACMLLKPVTEGPGESQDAHYRLIDTVTSPESLAVAVGYLQSAETTDPLALQALLSRCGQRGLAPLEWLGKLNLTSETLEWILFGPAQMPNHQKEAFLLATLKNQNPQMIIDAWGKAPYHIRKNAEIRVSTEDLIRIAKTLADHPNHPLFTVTVAKSLQQNPSFTFSLPMLVQSLWIRAAHIIKIMEACRQSIAYESLPDILLALQLRTDLKYELDNIKTSIIKSLEGHEYCCVKVFKGASLRMFIEDIVKLKPDALKEFVAHLTEEQQEHLAIHADIRTLQAIGNAYRNSFLHKAKLHFMTSCIQRSRWEEAEKTKALQALLGTAYKLQEVAMPAASSASSHISPQRQMISEALALPYTPLSQEQPPSSIEPDSGHSTAHDDSLNGVTPSKLHRTGSDSTLHDMLMTPTQGGLLEVTPPLSPRKVRKEAKSVLSQRPTEPLAQSMHKRSAAQSFQQLEVEDILQYLLQEGTLNEAAINLFIAAAKQTPGHIGEETILNKLTAVITKAQKLSVPLCTALVAEVMKDKPLRDRAINKELAQDLTMNLADPNTGQLPESLKGLTQYAFS